MKFKNTTMKKIFLPILLVVTIGFSLTAQEFNLGADFRSRFDYRHGFNNIVPSGVDPAVLIEQRARLNLGYNSEKFQSHFSIQNISVWGDTRQILPFDVNNNFQIADAWVALKFGNGWQTKIGRQALSYDDQRILGGLDWAMQGRFHDVALLRYGNEKSKLDIGLGFSQDALARLPGNVAGNIYNVNGFFSYKAIEYAHYNVKLSEGNSISLLAMNTTFQNRIEGEATEGFFHRHTFGTHSKFKLGAVGLALNAFYQTGEAATDVDLSAYLIGLESSFKAGTTKFGLGFELQSGTDEDATDGKNKSFFPLYGTNHKFNGFMDYFYVGNHANNVGLTDIYGSVVFKIGEKSGLLVKAHYFGANATLLNDTDGSEADSYLGTEVDIVYTQKLLPFATLKIGYSQMFAAEGMEFLKTNLNADPPVNRLNPSGLQNWGWAMLVVKPNFLKWKPGSN